MLRIVCLSLIIGCMFSCENITINTKEPIDQSSKQKAIIDTFFQYFNKHDWQKMADMYNDHPEMKDPSYGSEKIIQTKAAIIKKYTELQQMIPDLHDSVIATYSSNDNVIVEFISTGTSPDKTKFKLPICSIFEIREGKISKDYTYYDNF